MRPGVAVPVVSAVIGQVRVRRGAGLALTAVLEALLMARSVDVRSWTWRQVTKRLGTLGTIKSVEITTSKASGWHPHLHELVFTERFLSNEEFSRWRLGMRQPWANAVSRRTYHSVPRTGSSASGRTCGGSTTRTPTPSPATPPKTSYRGRRSRWLTPKLSLDPPIGRW
jgi:hypothetical protein